MFEIKLLPNNTDCKMSVAPGHFCVMLLYLLAFEYSWGIKVAKRHLDYIKNIKNNNKISFMTARVIQWSPL